MLNENETNEIQERIARLKDLEAEIANQIRLLKEIVDGLMHRGPQVAPKSHYLRVAEFLLWKRNRPRSAQAILKRTGISRSSLSQILHRTHKESFIATPIPGYSRKKLWSLTEQAAKEATRVLMTRQPTLFGGEGEFSNVKAVDCCARILTEHGNEPMNALTMAREALLRGYHGKAKGSEDEVLLTTAKSFWAALTRDDRFDEVRPLVFVLK